MSPQGGRAEAVANQAAVPARVAEAGARRTTPRDTPIQPGMRIWASRYGFPTDGTPVEVERVQRGPGTSVSVWLKGAPSGDEGRISLRGNTPFTIAPGTPARTAAPAGDSISRHVSAPVSVDIFETGAGQLDVGPNDNRTVYDLHRQDGKWYAEHMQGPSTGGQLSAAALPDLARKIADRHGVSGTVSIEDERGKGKSLSQRFEHTTKATPAVSGVDFGEIKKSDMVQADGAWGTVANVQPAVPGYEAEVQVSFQGGARKEWIPASRITAHESRRANQQAAAERAPRSEPFNPAVANGGNLPPRREGENDTAYSIRTAPSDDAARRLLNGYSVGGLRALLRSMNLSAPSGSNKADLVERAMQPRQRYWNSIAISKL